MSSSSGRKKIKVMAYLDKDQLESLEALVARTGLSKQFFFREGLDYIIEVYQRRLREVGAVQEQ